MAFSLHDCSNNGYNISTILNNIIGFTSCVCIFINTLDNTSGKQVTLGLYINSNFKECYDERSCGDEFSYIYTFSSSSFEVYRLKDGSSGHCCYFINTRSLRNKAKKLGIGLGKTYDGHKVWLDNQDLFRSSYFLTEDQYYQDGSPYENPNERLEVIIK